MKVVDVYSRYFRAEAVFYGTERKGALVKFTGVSEEGTITYSMSVSFFPHRDDEDFAVSYDAYIERTLYSAKGRRSRKKEEAFLMHLREVIDELSEENGARVIWDEPLGEERRG